MITKEPLAWDKKTPQGTSGKDDDSGSVVLGKRSSPPTDSTTQLLRPEVAHGDGTTEGPTATGEQLDGLLRKAREIAEADEKVAPKVSVMELLKRIGDGEEPEEFEQIFEKQEVLGQARDGFQPLLRLHDGQGAGVLYKLLEKSLVNLKRRN